jgi:hypothetical protein
MHCVKLGMAMPSCQWLDGRRSSDHAFGDLILIFTGALTPNLQNMYLFPDSGIKKRFLQPLNR